MDLWLIRHGETIANKQKILQGHCPGELTEVGFLQANTLGKLLSNYQFDKVYSSDSNRCLQTLSELLKNIDYKDEITVTQMIREKCGGVLEGKNFNFIAETIAKSNLPRRLFRPINGENFIDLSNRVMTFLEELISENVREKWVFKKLRKSQENIQMKNDFDLPSEVKFNKKERIFLKDLFEKVEINKSNNEENLLLNKAHSNLSSDKPSIIKSSFTSEGKENELQILGNNKPQGKLQSMFSLQETQIIEIEGQANNNSFLAAAQKPIKITDEGNKEPNIEDLIQLKLDNLSNEINTNSDESNIGRELDLPLNKPEIEFISEKKLHSKEEFVKKKKAIDSVFESRKNLNFKEIMVVTHGGWITEFFRVLRVFKNLDTESKTKYDNTSLNCVRIYCENCAGKCYKNEKECKLVMDIIFHNNTLHLDYFEFIN